MNPKLYAALVRRFGNVGIVSEGVEISWHIVQRANRQQDDTYPGRKVTIQGEEYVLDCPFCGDTRHRLLINHRWAVRDPELDTKNLWMMHCFNEECQSRPENQEQMYEMTFPLAGPGLTPKDLRKGAPAPERPVEVPPPGHTVNLARLAERYPQHHAIQYLLSRFQDPKYMGRTFGAGYCAQSNYFHANDRIIFPIWQGEKLVGWQARYIGDDVNGRSFKQTRIPKYYGCPTMCKKMLGFNYDRAIKHPTVVIVEGPMDVVGFGVQSFALMGKTMNPNFVTEFCDLMKRRWGPEARIVVMLDPKPDKRDAARGEHHIPRLVLALEKRMQPHQCVVPVYLPDDVDPGSIDRKLARQLAQAAADKLGLDLDFTKPKRTEFNDEKPVSPGRLKKRTA